MVGGSLEGLLDEPARARAARVRAEELCQNSAVQIAESRRIVAFSLVVAVAVFGRAQPTERRAERVGQLGALGGRTPAIEQAKTLVAAQYGVSREQAFKLLAQVSQSRNRKLREVAQDVIATAETLVEVLGTDGE